MLLLNRKRPLKALVNRPEMELYGTCAHIFTKKHLS